MTGRGHWWAPDSIQGRFVLILVAALVLANLLALAALLVDRERMGRAAEVEREVERLLVLVPTLEALPPEERRRTARRASTRLARVSVDDEPLVAETRSDRRSRLIADRIAEELGDREVAVAVMERDDGRWPGFRGERRLIGISIPLARNGGRGAQWLNLRTAEPVGQPAPVNFDVAVLSFAASVIAVLGGGLWFLRRLTRPLAELASAADAAGRGDRNRRLPVTGPREIRAAASAFNDMQDRIAQFDAERVRVLAAVGHDLRTPITGLRIRAEMIEDETQRTAVVRTLDDMTVMADGLVAYARGSREPEADTVQALAPLLGRIATERGVPLAVRSASEAQVRPVALGRAIGNLIDNALRYGRNVRMTLDRDGRDAIIRVDDDGPGIPEARIAGMFEPFVRGDDSRSADTGGAGLGLSIARTLVVAMGGSIALANRPEGGLSATIRLPTRRPG